MPWKNRAPAHIGAGAKVAIISGDRDVMTGALAGCVPNEARRDGSRFA